MYKHRLIFRERLTAYNVKKYVAEDIFDLITLFLFLRRGGVPWSRCARTIVCFGIIKHQPCHYSGATSTSTELSRPTGRSTELK